jgi:hypothetical protein
MPLSVPAVLTAVRVPRVKQVLRLPEGKGAHITASETVHCFKTKQYTFNTIVYSPLNYVSH